MKNSKNFIVNSHIPTTWTPQLTFYYTHFITHLPNCPSLYPLNKPSYFLMHFKMSFKHYGTNINESKICFPFGGKMCIQ